MKREGEREREGIAPMISCSFGGEVHTSRVYIGVVQGQIVDWVSIES